MPKAWMFLTVILVMLVGGGVVAYSQVRNTGVDIADTAFKAAANSEYLPVVARVNGGEIRGESVSFIMAGAAESLRIMPGLAEGGVQAPTPRDVLDSLIDLEVVFQEAKRRELTCSDEEVRTLAESQIGLGDAAVLEVWAGHLATSVDQLLDHPEVLKGYSKGCARSRLRQLVAPVDLSGDLNYSSALDPKNQVWREFVASLRLAADIEILEPSFQ